MIEKWEADLAAFEAAFDFLMKWEGGAKLHKHPRDPGGWTKYGISSAAYPDEDIPNLTEPRARQIYKQDYWDRVGADKLPPWLALPVFDAAVNQGPTRAIRWLQKSVGTTADGIVGRHTLGKTWAADPRTALTNFMARRALAYAAGLLVFRLGWMRRLIGCTIVAAGLMARPADQDMAQAA